MSRRRSISSRLVFERDGGRSIPKAQPEGRLPVYVKEIESERIWILSKGLV